ADRRNCVARGSRADQSAALARYLDGSKLARGKRLRQRLAVRLTRRTRDNARPPYVSLFTPETLLADRQFKTVVQGNFARDVAIRASAHIPEIGRHLLRPGDYVIGNDETARRQGGLQLPQLGEIQGLPAVE